MRAEWRPVRLGLAWQCVLACLCAGLLLLAVGAAGARAAGVSWTAPASVDHAAPYSSANYYSTGMSCPSTLLCAAVDGEGNAGKVYVVDAAGIVHLRSVRIGIQSPQFVQTQSGLQPGEVVILGNHSGLEDGERVQPHVE